MPKRRTASRIYGRERGGEVRYYGDFRDFGDVGGKREPLVEPGEKRATTDPDAALRLAGARVEVLEIARRNGKQAGRSKGVRLGDYAAAHLVAKAKRGQTTEGWLEASERFLNRAITFFGADRELVSIDVGDIRRWMEHLATTPGRKVARPSKGEQTPPQLPMSGGTIHHHLVTLQNLFRYAANEGNLPPGYNPCRDLLDKPKARRQEAKWLEVYEAALLLEAVRTYRPTRADLAMPFLHPLIAALLLTGGRRAEVLGLEVGDVNFERGVVTFRPNRWRRLKTATSHRSVPLWPQLAELLQPYLSERTAREVLDDRPTRSLLFPSVGQDGAECMVSDFRKVLDGAVKRAGWKAGEIGSKMFRHTYCAARLQSLDHGAPVGEFTVAKEMGHGGFQLVRRIYGHLGSVRHRSETVEYRVEQHEERLKERLAVLTS